MKHWIASIVMMTTLLGIGLMIFPAVAEDDNKLSVPVAFGRGLNTAQPGNLVNHVIIPNAINTKLDGVVHFLVAGFHQVVVYKPGTQPEDILVPGSGTLSPTRTTGTTRGSIRQGGLEIPRLPRLTPSSRVATLGLTP
jgi:hypothetical protein